MKCCNCGVKQKDDKFFFTIIKWTTKTIYKEFHYCEDCYRVAIVSTGLYIQQNDVKYDVERGIPL